MARPKIGIDVDQVLGDFLGAFRDEAESVLGRSLPRSTHEWGFGDWMSQTELSRVWQCVKATPDWFYLYVSPLPGVRDALNLVKKFTDPYFITTRCETAGHSVKRQTEMWLQELGIEFPTVLVTDEKGPLVAALGLKAFIDDKYSNLESVEKHSPNTKLYFATQSQNENITIPKTWKRVVSFAEFVDRII